MYYTVNIVFMNYFDSLIENSEIDKVDMHISQNWTTKEQFFSISLQIYIFIPWNEYNKPPSSFLKRLRETQDKPSKEYLESMVDRNLEAKF